MKDKKKVDVKRCKIWYANFDDETVGSEQKGSRPVLILQNNDLNEKLKTVVVTTITSQIKNDGYSHMPIKLSKPSMIQFEQIKTISKNRLDFKIGKLNSLEMLIAEGRLMRVLGLR